VIGGRLDELVTAASCAVNDPSHGRTV
jgi:hypothetical protein